VAFNDVDLCLKPSEVARGAFGRRDARERSRFLKKAAQKLLSTLGLRR
jgi:hypothetical protein